MPDDEKTDAENKQNREQIEQPEKTARGSRGNVHSEPDEHAPDFDAPPPLSH